jgi:hypothetical protein
VRLGRCVALEGYLRGLYADVKGVLGMRRSLMLLAMSSSFRYVVHGGSIAPAKQGA